MKKQVECCGVLQIVSVGPWHHIDETWAWVYPQIIDQMCCSRMEHLMFTPHASAFFQLFNVGNAVLQVRSSHSTWVPWSNPFCVSQLEDVSPLRKQLETNTQNSTAELRLAKVAVRLREQDHVQSAMRLHIDLFLGLGSQLLESKN